MNYAIRVSESDLQEHDKRLPNNTLCYFKLVSVGKKTLEDNDYQPEAICNLVRNQEGHYLFGETLDEIEQALHGLVDQFISAVRKKNHESKS